jgi:hypothetical protein
MKLIARGLAALALVGLVACGDDKKSSTDTTQPADSAGDASAQPDTTPDTTPEPDTAGDTTPEPDTTADTTPVTACDRNGFVAAAEDAGFIFGILNYVAQSTTATPVDVLTIQFIGDNGGAEAAGSYELTGENYENCGNCITIFVGCDEALGNCSKTFLAQSGTLDITAIGDSGDRLTGTLSNLVLAEVTIDDDFVSDLVPDGEIWCLENYAFDVGIQ